MNLTYTVQQKEISIKSLKDSIDIWFFGDVHWDTPSCDKERWRKFLKNSDTPNSYYFGMGDYMDFASVSEKKKMFAAGLHETTIDKFDMMAEADNRKFAQEIKQMRGKLLGLIEGNHHWQLTNGMTSTEDLAKRMDCQYLGWLCHYSLKIRYANQTMTTIHISACHGKAGGKTMGATLNQLSDLKQVFPVADIYAMGHDHRRLADPEVVLIPTECNGVWKVKQKEQMFLRSGSFLKSYEPEVAGYQALKLYRPSNLGATKITINFGRLMSEGNNRFVTEMHALV